MLHIIQSRFFTMSNRMNMIHTLSSKLTLLAFLCYMQVIVCITQSESTYQQLPIVVLICSYNNEMWVQKNLSSVFMQEYDNFRVIYIDDCSQDTTAMLVQSFIDTHNIHEKISLIVNDMRCRKMKNIYNGVHACKDTEIIVQLDGDDWFIDNQLLAKINHLYQSKDIWLTYGSDTLGYAQPTNKKTFKLGNFRQEKWIYAPTRSFYAWLFKSIKVEDFIAEHVEGFQGLFFPSADDLAFMFPMLEMAGDRCFYISEVNYKVNTHNPISNKKIEYDLQEASSLDIRTRKPYPLLTDPHALISEHYNHACADIIIIANDESDLEQLLTSLETFVTHKGMIHIVHNAQDSQLNDFDQSILTVLNTTPHDHVLIMKTKIQVTNDINLKDCIKMLEKTGAYGFYFAYSAQAAPCTLQHICNDTYAWKFSCGNRTLFNNIDMTLFRKKDILNKSIDMHAVGLCLQKPVLSGTITKMTTKIEMPEVYKPLVKKVKTRRLHVPGTDLKYNEEKNSRKSTYKENYS